MKLKNFLVTSVIAIAVFTTQSLNAMFLWWKKTTKSRSSLTEFTPFEEHIRKLSEDHEDLSRVTGSPQVHEEEVDNDVFSDAYSEVERPTSCPPRINQSILKQPSPANSPSTQRKNVTFSLPSSPRAIKRSNAFKEPSSLSNNALCRKLAEFALQHHTTPQGSHLHLPTHVDPTEIAAKLEILALQDQEEEPAHTHSTINLSNMNLGSFPDNNIFTLLHSLAPSKDNVENLILDSNAFGDCLSKKTNNIILLAMNLRGFPNLTYLSLQNNNLINLPKDPSVDLPNGQNLPPQKNSLTFLCKLLKQCQKLTIVDFRDNDLSEKYQLHIISLFVGTKITPLF